MQMVIITGSEENKNSYCEKRHGISSVFEDTCPISLYGSTEIELQLHSPSHHTKISGNTDHCLTKLSD